VLIHHHLYVAREASPARQCYADHGYQGARKIALGTNVSRYKYYICYVPRPTCQGSVRLYVPPLSYKRGGMQCYNKVPGERSHTHKQYNTQWTRVLRSGGPNHSKLLHVLVCLFPNLTTSKTLRPLLILGFRAGALRHPAGDFLSDIWRAK
jgi:hypothetical protein